MSPLRVLNAVADVTRLFGFVLLVPIPFAILYEPADLDLGFFSMSRNVLVFLASYIMLMLAWYPAHWATRTVRDDDLQDKEAYLTVGIGWIAITLFAMVPFLLSGVLRSPADAFFETMSGLTTTGASVIAMRYEDVPASIMIWRAMLQYLGGMGIIVLSVALLARLTQGGIQLLQAETPGPTLTRIRPKLAQTAKTLWAVYGIMTLILFAALFGAIRFHVGMAWKQAFYDALLHTFTTLSTGGFSNHTTSIAFFDSWLVEAVIIVFMLLAGSNFTLHYYLLHGDWPQLVRDKEWRAFMLLFFGVTLAATGLLWRAGTGLVEGARGALFTIASIGTSTGYATVDYDAWPDTLKLLLVVLMLTGATAGSTAGGMKVIRIILLMKIVRREIKKLLHPRAVIPIRLGHQVIKEETLMTVIAFFFSFITIWMIGAIYLITAEPSLGLVDGAAAAASMMGNTGPALGSVGPTNDYTGLSAASKLVMSMMMWIGRLEVFTALILISPRSWRT